MRLKTISWFILVLLFALFSNLNLSAQAIQQDLSKIRVDELSDAQVRELASKTGGLSNSQLERVATSRGMKPEEVKKLKDRLMLIKETDRKKLQNNDQTNVQTDTIKVNPDTLALAEKALGDLRSKIFGANLFSKKSSTFEPNLRLATPQNYQVGPDDELLIDIYGYSEASYTLKVTPEGTINIPYVGVIQVGGMTIEQATSRIRSRLYGIYPEIQSGNTSVRIAIGNIRSIKVILTGQIVKPGTYTIPSVASIFNALYESGGPTENGSFREIELIRGGRIITKIDIYNFLLKGELKNNIRLQDNDVIRVPTYHKRVELVGEVKRPGLFEMIEGESFKDLLKFAGGFTERAYQDRVKVLKNTSTERKISDLTADDFDTYNPSSGDKFFVDEILDRFENRVTIEGAVFRPGQYELEKGLTLSQLIKKAEGLREDAFKNRAYILRLKDDMQTELITVDLSSVLNGQASDIPLKREDVITISSIFDLKEEYSIQVEGEVRQPGKLPYAEGITLEDAILQSGGLKESATPQRVEISRRVKNSDALSSSAKTAEVFQINIDQGLKASTASFILKPFDIVIVRPSAGYEVQKQVKIVGQVIYPGIYTITKKNERISDLVNRAGGFTALAYTTGGSLRRPGPPQDSTKIRSNRDAFVLKKITSKLDSLGQKDGRKTISSVPDTIIVNASDNELNKNEFVGIDLPKIMESPYSKYDLFLEEGDILNIPKQLQTVKVSGQVLSPSTIIYAKGKGFKHYVASAGGFSELAKKRRSYIKYANGSVESTKRFLLFNNYPSVDYGAEIIIPEGPPKRPLNITEIVGLTTSIFTILLLFNQLKK